MYHIPLKSKSTVGFGYNGMNYFNHESDNGNGNGNGSGSGSGHSGSNSESQSVTPHLSHSSLSLHSNRSNNSNTGGAVQPQPQNQKWPNIANFRNITALKIISASAADVHHDDNTGSDWSYDAPARFVLIDRRSMKKVSSNESNLSKKSQSRSIDSIREEADADADAKEEDTEKAEEHEEEDENSADFEDVSLSSKKDDCGHRNRNCTNMSNNHNHNHKRKRKRNRDRWRRRRRTRTRTHARAHTRTRDSNDNTNTHQYHTTPIFDILCEFNDNDNDNDNTAEKHKEQPLQKQKQLNRNSLLMGDNEQLCLSFSSIEIGHGAAHHAAHCTDINTDANANTNTYSHANNRKNGFRDFFNSIHIHKKNKNKTQRKNTINNNHMHIKKGISTNTKMVVSILMTDDNNKRTNNGRAVQQIGNINDIYNYHHNNTNNDTYRLEDRRHIISGLLLLIFSGFFYAIFYLIFAWIERLHFNIAQILIVSSVFQVLICVVFGFIAYCNLIVCNRGHQLHNKYKDSVIFEHSYCSLMLPFSTEFDMHLLPMINAIARCFKRKKRRTTASADDDNQQNTINNSNTRTNTNSNYGSIQTLSQRNRNRNNNHSKRNDVCSKYVWVSIVLLSIFQSISILLYFESRLILDTGDCQTIYILLSIIVAFIGGYCLQWHMHSGTARAKAKSTLSMQYMFGIILALVGVVFSMHPQFLFAFTDSQMIDLRYLPIYALLIVSAVLEGLIYVLLKIVHQIPTFVLILVSSMVTLVAGLVLTQLDFMFDSYFVTHLHSYYSHHKHDYSAAVAADHNIQDIFASATNGVSFLLLSVFSFCGIWCLFRGSQLLLPGITSLLRSTNLLWILVCKYILKIGDTINNSVAQQKEFQDIQFLGCLMLICSVVLVAFDLILSTMSSHKHAKQRQRKAILLPNKVYPI